MIVRGRPRAATHHASHTLLTALAFLACAVAGVTWPSGDTVERGDSPARPQHGQHPIQWTQLTPEGHNDDILDTGYEAPSAAQPIGPLLESSEDTGHRTSPLPMDILPALIGALDVMQSQFFEVWQGTWPSSIDWTGAVLGTYISAALITLSSSENYMMSSDGVGGDKALASENLINKYFSHLTAYYFGQDAFSLRNEANDDMLWVVLGWLEGIKFIKTHSTLHYQSGLSANAGYESYTWYGTQFIPSLAHRARVFYDIASQGWDTSLCGGGMIWNPYLRPYKNAITNELFITASISMYLYFPGDSIASPFQHPASIPPAKAHDPKHLAAALEAYKWLIGINMTNEKGLFTDGYHVRRRNDTHNTKCDERNEMVYTYNQGVLLSGVRGLWESTGAMSFLDDGHALIAAVVNSTGWTGIDNDGRTTETNHTSWAGLGRDGVLEELCDASGKCSQDAQTFKGIFFHHLSLFCASLPTESRSSGQTFAASMDLAASHAERCASYGPWIVHNARAAYLTRDLDGKYGTWWGKHSNRYSGAKDSPMPAGAVDYRNDEALRNCTYDETVADVCPPTDEPGHSTEQFNAMAKDVNDRGRGRTVETQGGGVAVLRAYYEIVENGI